MKRLTAGIIIGIILATAVSGFASTSIRLIVDGKVIATDVAPVTIGGRVMVPARFVAESLGATVRWDAQNRSVIITSAQEAGEQQSGTSGKSKENPVPRGHSIVTPDGFRITVTNFIDGAESWDVIQKANMFNEPPASGMKYVLVTVTVENVSNAQQPALVDASSFKLVGSSNRIFNTFDRATVLPSEGDLMSLHGRLFRGGKVTSTVNFHIPQNESKLVLIWEPLFSLNQDNIRFFSVN